MEIIKSPEVSGWLNKNCDVCFLSETHMTKGEDFSIDHFKCVNNPFSDVLVKKPRGGLTCLIKHELMQHVTKIDKDIPDNIVVKFRGGHVVFGSYIPPSDSIYYEDACFTNIPNVFANSKNSVVIIGGGDLNSRVGDITQKVPILSAKYRANVDTVTNAHGKLLRKICNSYNCFVVNNLTIGDKHLDGDFTFHRGADRRSQNDICVANLEALRNLESFTIHKIGWNFSDHQPISCTVKFDLYDYSIPLKASADILSDDMGETGKRPRKVTSEQVNWNAYRTIASVEMEMLQEKIETLSSSPSSNILSEVVNTLSTKLYNAAKTCETKINSIVVPVANPTPEMNEANEMMEKYSSGLCSWGDWNDAKKRAVEGISKKHYSSLIQQWSETLGSNDPKKIWERINWKGERKDETKDESPDIEDIAKQFQSKDSGNDEHLLGLDFGDKRVPMLDQEISLEEIKEADRHLKSGKSTADGWVPEMLTAVSDTLYPILHIIFNIILLRGMFPVNWWLCVVIALFKNKGVRSIAKNFRPVSLVVMLSKLFDFIMLGRFKKWFTPHDMNTAYQNGKSCCDHIFFMRCVRERMIKLKRTLFVTAVDFDGAFDRVNRRKLLQKLLLKGASSVFVLCLANLYSVSKNTIYHNGASVTYLLYSGIKQGLPLSPYLFLFYIDDVFDYLDAAFNVADVTDVFDRLHILIHADDANLLATTRVLMIRKIKMFVSILPHERCYSATIQVLVHCYQWETR